jgi:NAD(P)-dependent dehydrogenase (short-subunit alcohol dehydrogenase family)
VSREVECTLERYGRIDVLVNNAGYAFPGALEEISDEQVQKLFDVNVFGSLRMIRAVVAHMRRQRAGRIINLSSIRGKLVVPASGAYSATKFALEAMSDALRFELASFGIKVVLIEPASIKTHFADTARSRTREIFSNTNSPYRGLYQRYRQVNADMRQHESGPEAVSRIIQQAIEAPRPKARYLVADSFSGKLVLHLGSSAWDLVVRRMFKIAPQGGLLWRRKPHPI